MSGIVEKELEKRERYSEEFDVRNIFGLGGKNIPKVAFRICSKSEEFDAVISAHTWLKDKAAHLPEAKSDEDILLDLKTTFVMFTACRRAESGDKEAGYIYPAFPGPQWMIDNFTTDEFAELLNTYNSFKASIKPDLYSFSLDRLDDLIAETAVNHDSRVPEVVLSSVSREWLVQAFMVMARRLWELRYDGRGGDVRGSDAGSDEESGGDTGQNQIGSREGRGVGEEDSLICE